jgi:hypothetical protein
MGARAEPVCRHHRRGARWQFAGRYDRSPSHTAGGFGLARPEQLLPDFRVNTIRANDERCACCFVILKPDVNLSAMLAETDTPPGQMDRLRLEPQQGIHQKAVQIAPMQQHVGRAIFPAAGRAEVVPIPSLSGSPMTDFLAQRRDSDSAELFLEPERNKNPRAIWADLDASAHLTETRSLPMHVNVDTSLQQRERGRQTANSAADDNHLAIASRHFLSTDVPIALDRFYINGGTRSAQEVLDARTRRRTQQTCPCKPHPCA